jgi:hypothetical protein
MRDLQRGLTVIAFGTLALLHAKDSPAPPPPILNCSSGTPVSIALQYPVDVHGSINSALANFQIQAFDGAGNPLAGVDVTVRAPASGPSASFLISVANYNVVPAPDPLQVTVTTATNCQGAMVWSIANGLVGSYEFIASAEGVPQSLLIPATNTPPEAPASVAAQDLSTQRIAHTGSAFPPVPVVVRGASGSPIAGIPITVKTPMSGPSATFPDGTSSATVYSDAFGRAIAPTLTANSQVGTFNVTASAPGVAQIKAGPFVNAGATQILLDSSEADEPVGGFVATFFVIYGRTLPLRAWVIFPGLPLPPYPNVSPDLSLPHPNGRVTLRVDGNVIATTALDQFYYIYTCATCPGPTLAIDFQLNDAHIGFGKHQLSATYEADSAYDASVSVPNELRMFSEFPLATSYGQTLVGATGGSPYSWGCSLESPAWSPITQVGSPQAAPYTFPYGLLNYRLDQCAYHGAYFDAPPPLFQILAVQTPVPLSPGTVFVNYGPTAEDPSPHFYALGAEIDGTTIRVPISDGRAGDDDMARNGVISGLGGPALPYAPLATVTLVEFYAASLDHYFMSVDTQEIAALDNQLIPGWMRTGLSFKAYLAGTSATSAVCRFYIPPQDGDSHFYSASASECAQTRQRFPSFVYESPDVFHVGLPDPATGNCALGTVPVYRVWNNRPDSNHRYTTSRTIRDQMVARGYVAEGYGPDAAIMCAAP